MAPTKSTGSRSKVLLVGVGEKNGWRTGEGFATNEDLIAALVKKGVNVPKGTPKEALIDKCESIGIKIRWENSDGTNRRVASKYDQEPPRSIKKKTKVVRSDSEQSDSDGEASSYRRPSSSVRTSANDEAVSKLSKQNKALIENQAQLLSLVKELTVSKA